MSHNLNRRCFAMQLVAGAAVPIATANSSEQADPASKKLPVVEKLAAAELILELVKKQYPDPHLDTAVLEEIRDDIEKHLSRSAILSRFPLTNADEPAFVFAAFRADVPQRQEP